jgi:hypothetical protein
MALPGTFHGGMTSSRMTTVEDRPRVPRGTPGGGLGHDSPDQARLRQLAEEQVALRRIATLVARGTASEQVFAAVIEEVGWLLPVDVVSMGHYQIAGVVTFVARWGRLADRLSLVSERPLGGRNVGTLVFETGRPARVDGYADSSSLAAERVRQGEGRAVRRGQRQGGESVSAVQERHSVSPSSAHG